VQIELAMIDILEKQSSVRGDEEVLLYVFEGFAFCDFARGVRTAMIE
jgi:hypothetical protein